MRAQTLKELMAKRQPEMGEVLQMAKQLCAALDYAHSKGVFHNFLNPYNIKVLPDGTLKMLDFGLLRDKNLLTQSPTKKLENEPYLSPEQVKNKPSDRAANLFCLATIVYQLYTARSPFHGPHLGEVDRAITDVNPHPMQMAHPRVPEQISNVVLKALSKNPAERYASGQQFFAALEEAAKFQPVAARQFHGIHARVSGRTGSGQRYGIKTCIPGRSGAERQPVIQSFLGEPGVQCSAIAQFEPGDQNACAGNDARCRAADRATSAGKHGQPLEAGGRRGRRPLRDCWVGDDLSAPSRRASRGRWDSADNAVGREHAGSVQSSTRHKRRTGQDAYATQSAHPSKTAQERTGGSGSAARAE